jgi:hypothetical protein
VSRIPQFIDSQLTDDGEVVSHTHQPPFTPMKIPGGVIIVAKLKIKRVN